MNLRNAKTFNFMLTDRGKPNRKSKFNKNVHEIENKKKKTYCKIAIEQSVIHNMPKSYQL